MKKTTTYPDGRVEVVEGTAEEIAESEGHKATPFYPPIVVMPYSIPALPTIRVQDPPWYLPQIWCNTSTTKVQ